jgi:hypothetical protein
MRLRHFAAPNQRGDWLVDAALRLDAVMFVATWQA